jgi:hypothetical protein
MSGDYQNLKFFSSQAEAEIARGLLVSNGIDALISSDDAGGMEPPLQYTAGVRLKVPASQLATAMKLLDDTLSAEAQQEPWHCKACGQENEGHFAVCWNCGAERD